MINTVKSGYEAYKDNVITIEEFELMQNVCINNPCNPERLEDDIDCIFEEALYQYEQNPNDLENIIEQFKEITVYKKNMVNFSSDFVTDYISDNYYIEPDWVNGLEELELAIEKFNSQQTAYTSGKPIGTIDCSKELEKYIKGLTTVH